MDSSFFFPFINVEVVNCEKSDVLKLIKEEKFKILRSELTTFELSAKGVKLVNDGTIEINDLIDGLSTLQHLNSITVIPIYYSEIQILASNFRKEHSDFIDCIILASAVNHSKKFITLDDFLKKKFSDTWKKNLQIKTEFEILLWDDFRKSL